jgi:hypothetical protein
MPTDSLLFAIGVCAMFLLFAFVLAWVDHTTSRWLSDKAAAEQNPDSAEPPQRKAA